MTVYVREDMATAGNWEKNFAKLLFRDVKKITQASAKQSIRPLRMRTIRAEAIHTSKFGRGWKVKAPNKWTTVIYNRAQNTRNRYYYGVTIEAGRRAGGRMPPRRHLENWALDKVPELVELYGLRSATFIIARAIARNGIRPRPIMTSGKMQRDMQRRMMRALSKMWVSAAEKARLGTKAPSKKGGS